MKFDITLLSSHAHDILINSETQQKTVKPGGPALFIERVFHNESVSYNPVVKKDIQVEVIVYEDGEKSKILPIPVTVAPIEKFAGSLVISTLLREWDISNLINYKGKVLLDVQGYVRDGSSIGGKKSWEEFGDIMDSIYALKGTSEEINYLPKGAVEQQKNKILIITNGAEPVILYVKNTKHTIPVTRVENLKNTVGAGDTFFAYFVVAMVRGVDPLAAAKYAAERTSSFLQNKD